MHADPSYVRNENALGDSRFLEQPKIYVFLSVKKYKCDQNSSLDEKFSIKMIPFLYFILKYILFTYSRNIFQFLGPKMESVAHKPFW